jgi:hypothetical protein
VNGNQGGWAAWRSVAAAVAAVAALALPGAARASATRACDAPLLPLVGTRIVNVSIEADLQRAVGSAQTGDTIVLAKGTYGLTATSTSTAGTT